MYSASYWSLILKGQVWLAKEEAEKSSFGRWYRSMPLDSSVHAHSQKKAVVSHTNALFINCMCLLIRVRIEMEVYAISCQKTNKPDSKEN